MAATSDLLNDLEQRGLVHQQTGDGALAEHLASPRTVYCGFDPTAESLHIGSLVPLLALRRFQLAGHKPIALVGGATGLIGDPSFKAAERQLNTEDVVAGWVDRLHGQVSQFIDFDAGGCSAEVVNNLDWVSGINVLDFLRDVGKHFSVNSMIHKESVRQRLQREGEGISFTEFSYMLLQSYDYAELYKRHACTVQIGGSDQWGNITGGIDLTRRMHQGHVHGLTLPLITKTDGSKFGKTEQGTIWLSAEKTSPYAFYQFWLNTADADVYRFLKYFTFLPVSEIDQIEQEDASAQGKPRAQAVLAAQVTELVHGRAGVEGAARIAQALFSGDAANLSEADYRQLQLDGLPSTAIDDADLVDQSLVQILTDAGMVASGKQVKDALQRKAVVVNDRQLGIEDNMKSADVFAVSRARFGRYYLVKLGKKKYHLVCR